MSFLEPTTARKKDYQRLGYTANPFPIRGEVRPEIYFPRPEIGDLQQALADFVFHAGNGALFAIEAQRGVGKSNLLQHIDWNLQQLEDPQRPDGLAHRYVTGQSVQPRALAEQIVLALGEQRFRSWLARPPQLPPYLAGTDLGRLVGSTRNPAVAEIDENAQLLMRWLSGHQTYAPERREVGIWARERLEAGPAFTYLRGVVDGMVALGVLKGVVLLLDEAEDIIANKTRSTDYVMALKALVNTFNFGRLFVVVAGQEGAISRIGQLDTSLASRWRVFRLNPVLSSAMAVDLAQKYMYPTGDLQTSRRPGRTEIEALFGRLASNYKQGVPQRELLSDLHQWVESEAGR